MAGVAGVAAAAVAGVLWMFMLDPELGLVSAWLGALGIDELVSVSDHDEELPTVLGAPPVLPLTLFVRADGTVAHVLVQPMDSEQDVLDAVAEHLGVTA